MQMSAVSPVVQADPRQVHQQFQAVIEDMIDANARLNQLSNTNSYPVASWADRFGRMSAALDDARIGYYDITRDRATTAQLGEAVRDISVHSGILRTMARHQHTFADWRDTLTNEISVARDAANNLFNARPPQYPDHPPVPVPPHGGGGVADAARAASQFVSRSLDIIQSLPRDDHGSEATKQARLDAFALNKQAQDTIEPLFNSTADPRSISALRRADAHLEDAAWQLTKQPSPDGRFYGVDIPGAVNDTTRALDQLRQLANA